MTQVLGNIKIYIRHNWLFLLIMITCSVALFIQMNEVVLYADDYALGMYSSGGIQSAWDYFTNHYMTWGGGYTSFIVIFLLIFPSVIWKIFLTSLLVLFVGLSVKMLCKNHPTYKGLVAGILWSCIFILSIWISREVIYWLDGSVAYLFSMFQAFLLFYFLYTRVIQKISKKYDYVMLPLIAFFAGWSSAQSGVMAIVVTLTLILWQKFCNKKPIRKLYIITTILSILGFCIFYFAPGNSARMESFTDFASYNIFEKILFRFDSVTGLIFNTTQSEFTATPLFLYLTIGLISVISLSNIRLEKNKKIKTIRLFCSIYCLAFTLLFLISMLNIPGISTATKYCFKYINLLNIHQYGTLGIVWLFPYLLTFLAIITSLIDAFFICKRHKNDPLLFTTLFLGYIAEFSMLLAPYSPLRTTFYTITCMWLAIGYLFIISYQEKINILPFLLLIFAAININLCILIIILTAIIFYLFKANKKEFLPDKKIVLILIVFASLAVANYTKILINYHRNKVIDDENITRIIDCKTSCNYNNESEEQILYLKKPANEIYGFTGLAGIKWVENGVRLYFGLPSNVNLEYEEGATQ